jgi:hypothetical protein
MSIEDDALDTRTMSRKEACAALLICDRHLSRLIARGVIKARRAPGGNRTHVLTASVERYKLEMAPIGGPQ